MSTTSLLRQAWKVIFGSEAQAPHWNTGKDPLRLRAPLSPAGCAQVISIIATLKDTGFTWAAATTALSRVDGGYRLWKLKVFYCGMSGPRALPWWKTSTTLAFPARVRLW